MRYPIQYSPANIGINIANITHILLAFFYTGDMMHLNVANFRHHEPLGDTIFEIIKLTFNYKYAKA